VNTPLAERYEYWGRHLGVKFHTLEAQAADKGGSTDQGDVSHEIPAIQGVFGIDAPDGQDCHAPRFAEVLSPGINVYDLRPREPSRHMSKLSSAAKSLRPWQWTS
jgi:hypothetical protein